MQEETNAKWILIISLIMIAVTWYGGMIFAGSYFQYGRAWTVFDHVAYWTSRIATLFFIATLTTATLSTAGFRKGLLYRVSIYLFIASMILLFVNVSSWLFRT